MSLETHPVVLRGAAWEFGVHPQPRNIGDRAVKCFLDHHVHICLVGSHPAQGAIIVTCSDEHRMLLDDMHSSCYPPASASHRRYGEASMRPPDHHFIVSCSRWRTCVPTCFCPPPALTGRDNTSEVLVFSSTRNIKSYLLRPQRCQRNGGIVIISRLMVVTCSDRGASPRW